MNSSARYSRCLDLAVCLGLLVPFAAVAVSLVILNPWFNPGPLFFRQPRVGQGEHIFWIWKFRTMKGADQPGQFAPHQTDRIPPIGQFLRRFHLDEVPQLINVLRAEMGVVGPRPEQHCVYENLAYKIPCYRARMIYKPGLTAPSQIKYGYATTRIDHVRRTRSDLSYFAQATLISDLGVILQTAAYLVFWHKMRAKIELLAVQR